jgi:hypothetical protein
VKDTIEVFEINAADERENCRKVGQPPAQAFIAGGATRKNICANNALFTIAPTIAELLSRTKLCHAGISIRASARPRASPA